MFDRNKHKPETESLGLEFLKMTGNVTATELATAAIGLLVNQATPSDAQGGSLVSAAAGITSMLLAGQSSRTRDATVTDSKSRDITPVISREIDVKDIPVPRLVLFRAQDQDQALATQRDDKPFYTIVTEKKKESVSQSILKYITLRLKSVKEERPEAVNRLKETTTANTQSLQYLSLNDALSLMSDYTPLPSCPWITTMYNQSTNEISKEQNAIMKQVESKLYGILEKSVLTQWQDEDVKQDVKKKWAA
ncbi:UNVERIFIED_CONTAM: hypothetical protein HDU68_009886 [Siphonaria sp. JEL0065]|nr:hypothetical protein HDU68_009886 [Siphonaria sp. JEL0065]